MAAVSAVTADEREVVAVVLHMLRRQSIRLACERPALRPASLPDRDLAQLPARGAAPG